MVKRLLVHWQNLFSVAQEAIAVRSRSHISRLSTFTMSALSTYRQMNAKSYRGRSHLIFLFLLLQTSVIVASLEINDNHCPHLAINSCPTVTLDNGEVVQYLPKLVPPDLTWLSNHLPDADVVEGVTHFYCAKPACLSGPCLHGGTCEETDTGFNCTSCLDGYRGDRCEYDAFIHTLKLVGGNQHEGRIVFTTRSNPTKSMRIHQEHWNKNSSDLICRYLGFEGAFATVSGVQYNASSIDANIEAASVICPPNTTNITDCWHNETKDTDNEENIAVVCCPELMCNPLGDPLGLERGTIPDSAITSSGCINSTSYCTQHARLNGPSAWIPDAASPKWVDVQFESSYVVTGIAIQGSQPPYFWTTSYTISFGTSSGDRYDYVDVYTREIQTFPGSYDREPTVTNAFVVPMLASSIRITPSSYVGIALRLELYGYGPLNEIIASMNHDVQLGCTPPVVGERLGVEDSRIPNSSLTYSSNPYGGRLNAIGMDGVAGGVWVASTSDKRQSAQNRWMKVDLGKDCNVTGVITQGSPNSHRRYTSFLISHSLDNNVWTFALERECGSRRTYPGNFDKTSLLTTLFPKPVRARYIRVHPTQWNNGGGLRLEILGVGN